MHFKWHYNSTVVVVGAGSAGGGGGQSETSFSMFYVYMGLGTKHWPPRQLLQGYMDINGDNIMSM